MTRRARDTDPTRAPDARVRSAREVRLACRAPYDAAGTRAFLVAHAIPGRDELHPDFSLHAIDAPGGLALARVEWARIVEDAERVEIPVDLELADPADEAHVASTLHRMLDLDADPGAIGACLGQDPVLGPLVAARPGLRVGGAREAVEFAFGVVLGQQVSLAAARTLQGRFARRFARGGPDERSRFVLGPDPAAVAAVPEAELREAIGITGTRAATLRALAVAVAAGLDLGAEADATTAREALAEIRGIGPWTVEVIALRALRDADAFPSGDLILRRALGDRTARSAEKLAEAWRPVRGYATQHLWTDFLSRPREGRP
ncbi:DNA-3-methyladenine glycosylase 2 family protein [Leucobacter sp. CSA2]|uniref:DNA-3-methyladenine glycosylase II n=1 Tax=Leucobacter edaphi TaxID=2796472 RepID=A0A934QDH5_9MICO|nr:DNA-3-methyladenine glycosylase 2 family protein [Leucobacter edaphi]MBK0421795.1 DNA-3-methyladenine glycosylase 2 family protein [Leucobacter edaphi]